MKKNLLLGLLCFVCMYSLTAQDNRSIDGNGNNPFYTEWGAVNDNLRYFTTPAYMDGISVPAGMNRPNPREISNALFAQPGLVNDPLGLSDFTWVFGQFIDHDITLTENNNEFFPIPVPMGDPWFDPFSTGNVIIPMSRNVFDPTTGNAPGNPRQSFNQITAFVDGSAVYGSDEERADWLRTFEDGKLKVSSGNLLPYNTTTGEFDDPVDPNAPHMADDVGVEPRLFVAGDVRANENVLLLTFHTLFVREHNRICDNVIAEHPDWEDEQVYQYARKMVSGYFQNIVFNEWLPSMGVNLPPYGGYKLNADPRILNVFSAAAFRLGHTLLNPNILRLDENGDVIPEGNLGLRDAFFVPSRIKEGGVDPLIKGMAVQIQQGLDNKVVDDVRNFLFGPPGAGGLDLVSLNINRGRDRGLADFNTIRQSFGLAPFTTFEEIVDDADEAQILSDIYEGDISLIDPWVGMLTEDPMPGALFGETLMEIMKFQFQNIRDGDRYFFMNDPLLTETDKAEIKNTRLVDIIRRNSNVTIVQDDLFGAMEHNKVPTCVANAPEAIVKGWVNTTISQPLDHVKIELFDGFGMMPHSMTVSNGGFDFGMMKTCYDYRLIPYKNDDADNGVTTLDLILTQQHILNINKLNSPYKIIAADADHNGRVSTSDLINMRQVILHVREEFYNNTSWRFIPENYTFDNPTDPLNEYFPESMLVDLHAIDFEENFLAIKIGDVDEDADPDGLGPLNDRPIFTFDAEDQAATTNEMLELVLTADEANELIGGQFTLNFDPTLLELTFVDGSGLPSFSEESYNVMAEKGAIMFSWNGDIEATAGDAIVRLQFLALKPTKLSQAVSINSRYTRSEVYRPDFSIMKAALRFDGQDAVAEEFALYQNTPNPVSVDTRIEFYMPEAGEAELTLTDIAGKRLFSQRLNAQQGLNGMTIQKNDLRAATGIVIYTVKTEYGTQSRKMIVAN